MPTPPGFADISYEFGRGDMTRKSYLTFGVDPTATDPSAVAASCIAAYNAAGGLKNIMDFNVNLTGCRVSLGTDGTEDIVHFSSANLPGVRSGTATPPNVSLLVHKKTSRGGRRGRGRLFIPWALSNTDIAENGQISAGILSTYQGILADWLAALNTQGVPMVLLHRESEPWDPVKETGVRNPTTPGPPTAVHTLTADALVSTQRRRLGR